jgi:hypothetical protein
MTSVPLPTFVPQDAWYTLTTGQINPSEADSVPNITYLHPSVTPQGEIDGVVGSLDGAIIYLAGLASELDGGQKFLMWIATSMQVDDGINVFCPFADPTKPGRWVNTLAGGGGAIPVQSVQIILAGGTKSVGAAPTTLVRVFVLGRDVAGATTLNMPGSTFAGQTFTIKDSNGDAGASNIIVVAPSIDGATSDTLANDYAERGYTWNGTEWSIS